MRGSEGPQKCSIRTMGARGQAHESLGGTPSKSCKLSCFLQMVVPKYTKKKNHCSQVSCLHLLNLGASRASRIEGQPGVLISALC